MARALSLAARALGSSSPNPAVGAVVVQDGRVVGEGATRPPGQAHAEVVALTAAGPAARGSTLFVTLEPCAHHGRTPPCVDAIIEAGVAAVNVATIDPSPWVNGRGIAALERAGIAVTMGRHAADARRLNQGYFTWVSAGRPLVTGVYALSLDGRVLALDAADLTSSAEAELAELRRIADRTLRPTTAEPVGSAILTALAADGVTSVTIEAGPDVLDALARGGLLDRLAVFVVPVWSSSPRRSADRGAEATAPAWPVPGAAPPGSQPHRALSSVTFERLGETLLVRGDLAAPATSSSEQASGAVSGLPAESAAGPAVAC